MTKPRMFLPFFSVLCLAGAIIAAPLPAQASWLEFFFPQLKPKGHDPVETLQAPFADPDAVIDPTAQVDGLGENATPLNLRHRSNAIISKWVEEAVSDLLAYDAATYNDQYRQKSTYFDPAGLKEYVKFLQEQNIVTSLRSGQYNVRSFVQDVPIAMNEGEIDGRYRWAYQIRVMVSFVSVGMKSYKEASDSDSISKEYTINVQIGRSDNAKNEHGLFVEGWEMRSVR